jgi:hypothetical protein
MDTFSDRFGYKGADAPITVREDAPTGLREALSMLAYDAGLQPKGVRSAICEVLLRRPNPDNWSDYPNVAGEVEDLIDGAPWNKVYDIAEKLYRELHERDPFGPSPVSFQARLNSFMNENGIGWEMQDGRIKARGSEAFAVASQTAVEEMKASGRATAAAELHEALNDISRRPHADVTGAIQHAMAALECVARDVTGTTDTLGKIVSQLGVPKPLDAALEKLWGFASEQGRHIREGRQPQFEEAELIVTVASAVSIYLIRAAKVS